MSSSWIAGRYELERTLGAGDLAEAFAAWDRLTGDRVALKLARTERDHETLRREFAALSAVSHPRLVRARDFGWLREPGRSRPFYVADQVRGDPLGAWWPQRDAVARARAIADVANALDALHRAGVRHGDVKPDNILVGADGRATLLDLSCAARLDAVLSSIAGTPGYLAPELLTGRGDGRADLFALGRTLRALGALDPPLDALAARLLAPDPADRPAVAEAVVEELTARYPSAGIALERYGPTAGRGARFVGRDGVLAAFAPFLERLRARRPGPRVLALTGASGMGRTRALAELAWRAQPVLATAPGRGDETPDAILSRALGRDVGPGMDARMDAIATLGALESEPRLLLLDDADRLAASLAALIPESGSLGAVVAVDVAPSGSIEVPLGPIGPEAIADWARDAGVPEVDTDELARLTGGRPVEIVERLERAARGRDWRSQRSLCVPDSADDEVRTAVFLASWLGPSRPDELTARGVTAGSIEAGLREGWLRASDGRVRANARIGGEVSPSARRIAERALDGASPLVRARLLLALGRSELARAEASAWRDSPREWLDVLDALEERPTLARACIAAGDLERADATLAELDVDGDPSAATAAAELALKRGHSHDVLRLLQGIDSADAADLRSRASLARGSYADAREEALRALSASTAHEPRVARRLRETVALADGYRGEPNADDALAEVARAHADAGDWAGQLRVLSYRGILAHLSGDHPAAIERYEAALDVARTRALDDALAVGWLNLGTARQENGDFGGALEAYERGSRYAELCGQGGTEASLRFNLANLMVEIGHLDRAEQLAALARQRADELGARGLDAPLARLDAEIAAGRGQVDDALARLDTMRVEPNDREALEASALRAEILVVAGRLDDARRALDTLERSETPPDLTWRAFRARARLALASGELRDAVRFAERALHGAERGGGTLAAAEAHAILSSAHRATPELEAEHRSAARKAWRRTEASLPEVYRDAFVRHPRRASVFDADRAPAPASSHSRARLRRFLEINRQLGASLEVEAVLERAMDAAIELAEAERGFVLVLRDGDVRVAAARNLDKESVPDSHYEFSRSIAERVIRTDTPVVTVDARADERFAGERSVHAMRLQSVACVPIRTPDGVRGALYLDNRFERGRFGDDDLEILQAFADQVAIAMRNAELHAALEARTRALDEARAALEARVDAQAAEIDQLFGEVRTRQRALEYRYDYDRIVGRSPGMRAVLDVLERVIDSELSVLIRGESGTGKELVAKAIHYNGRRKGAPMVSLNCAALPDALIESELFGHVRGAFTGAERDRAGLLVTAAGGTVFLDELGEMSASVQAKLLRAIQEREVRPVGASSPVPIDVRVLAATNRDLRAEVRAGRFREDLYYRIAVVELELPPLRERLDDLLPLSESILAELGDKRLTVDALGALRQHGWPGNVRELRNVLSRAHTFAEGGRIEPDDLALPAPTLDAPTSRDAYLGDEASRIRAALRTHRWNVSRVSRELGIPRQTLYRRIRALDISRERGA